MRVAGYYLSINMEDYHTQFFPAVVLRFSYFVSFGWRHATSADNYYQWKN